MIFSDFVEKNATVFSPMRPAPLTKIDENSTKVLKIVYIFQKGIICGTLINLKFWIYGGMKNPQNGGSGMSLYQLTLQILF